MSLDEGSGPFFLLVVTCYNGRGRGGITWLGEVVSCFEGEIFSEAMESGL